MAKISKALRIKPYQLLLPEENKNFDVTLHEDVSELGQFITQTVENKIKFLMKKYSM